MDQRLEVNLLVVDPISYFRVVFVARVKQPAIIGKFIVPVYSPHSAFSVHP